MFGVSAGVGTTTITTAAAIGWMRNTDPIVGVLVGSTTAIALCSIVSALFLFRR